MKKTTSILAISLTSIIFIGCGTSYVNLDGTKAQEQKIKMAKKKCDVDNKIYNLNQELDIIDYTAHAINAEGKVAEQYEQMAKDKEEKVYAEINACLEKEGIKAEK